MTVDITIKVKLVDLNRNNENENAISSLKLLMKIKQRSERYLKQLKKVQST